ncbi:MAG: hypothetical protein HC767_14705 [Akkermansiaceae bacterium]|nr:hypothetical protein [Akkermansiaceae bacterium]
MHLLAHIKYGCEGSGVVPCRVRFRLARFADVQHAAASRYLDSEEHSSHKELLVIKHRSVKEMERTIGEWKATGNVVLGLDGHCHSAA